ncbi:MAG: NAD-dependent epimerase/dehydratase family protein, partial [Candidatus Hydrogenedentes bacterium]|nr:NAD-dependent epimerase/dehydratase family protein [Candidatus Hydrogenedentota bacterium]
ASELCPPNPKCHYAASKLAFEHYLRLYHALYELPYTILRFPNVYGPRQSPEGEAGVCSILIGLMLRDRPPTLYGYGTPLRDYVYVGDIARGNVLALDQGENETINLGSGKGTSVQELFDTLRRIMDFAGEPRLEPIRPGEVQSTYITGDLAEELLGWRPEVDLETGLRNTVAHIRGTLP